MLRNCNFGINEFKKRNGLTKEEYSLDEVLKMTVGEFGHQTLIDLLNK